MLKILPSLLRKYKVKKNPVAYAKEIGVEIGENCRLLGLTPSTFGSEPFLIKIGNHVTITAGVRFVTHDGGVWVFRREEPNIDVFGSIKIGNNVFIGLNSIIMPNVEIGDNVVIGAGSVVTKDVKSNTVVAGTPAKYIKTIEAYEESIKEKALYIRNEDTKIKKRKLQKKFFPEELN